MIWKRTLSLMIVYKLKIGRFINIWITNEIAFYFLENLHILRFIHINQSLSEIKLQLVFQLSKRGRGGIPPNNQFTPVDVAKIRRLKVKNIKGDAAKKIK